MFFNLTNKKDKNFTHQHILPNGNILNTDAGWEKIELNEEHYAFVKGYNLESKNWNQIINELITDPTPQHKGNFCIVLGDSEYTKICHCIDRGFPLFKQESSISNIYQHSQRINVDNIAVMNSSSSVIIKQDFKTDYSVIEYSFNDGLEKLHNIFCETTEKFLLQNKRPLKVFLTGGIDTLTCYSYIKKFTNNFELIDYEYKKFTYFYRMNWHERLRKFWGYQNCHSWGDESVSLATGGCGDEYSLRGPYTANILLRHWNIDVNDFFKNRPGSYHEWYFLKDKNQETYIEQANNKLLNLATKSLKTTHKFIINNLANDHQHWHLDNTIFYTPFKNLEIPKTILGMPKEDVLNQISDAQINKSLISLNDSADLKLLCPSKNREPIAVYGV